MVAHALSWCVEMAGSVFGVFRMGENNQAFMGGEFLRNSYVDNILYLQNYPITFLQCVYTNLGS